MQICFLHLAMRLLLAHEYSATSVESHFNSQPKRGNYSHKIQLEYSKVEICHYISFYQNRTKFNRKILNFQMNETEYIYVKNK